MKIDVSGMSRLMTEGDNITTRWDAKRRSKVIKLCMKMWASDGVTPEFPSQAFGAG